MQSLGRIEKIRQQRQHVCNVVSAQELDGKMSFSAMATTPFAAGTAPTCAKDPSASAAAKARKHSPRLRLLTPAAAVSARAAATRCAAEGDTGELGIAFAAARPRSPTPRRSLRRRWRPGGGLELGARSLGVLRATLLRCCAAAHCALRTAHPRSQKPTEKQKPTADSCRGLKNGLKNQPGGPQL